MFIPMIFFLADSYPLGFLELFQLGYSCAPFGQFLVLHKTADMTENQFWIHLSQNDV